MSGQPVSMPVAQPVGYEMPQQPVVPVTVVNPAVVHTGQPLTYGPVIAAPTSFLPREDSAVQMQTRSNGYAQLSQYEP
jgi:hypothetical protein